MKLKLASQTYVLGAFVAAALILANTGCSTLQAEKAGKGGIPPNGAQLWSQHCVRCHNLRQPDRYTDAKWEVVMMHMRVRANLSADQHAAILHFLQSAN
ncbi:MAG: hypothetical protein KDB61_12985 [Planctomycetes bacterium]|nr:hypothetical protein [Planctomycetota bacterium]